MRASKKANIVKYSILLIITAFVIVADQVTKNYIDKSFRLEEMLTIIPNFLDIHYILNTGAAFGIMSRLPGGMKIPFLIGVSIMAMLLIFYLLIKAKKDKIVYIVSLSLVFAGAVGNLIDRIMLGGVRDFISMHIYRLHWPVFNVADSAITVGIVLLAYELIIAEPKRERETEAGR
ncbi:MAG: signal peptidase II [Deltaproteobacteria bacterium]|uniref:Lipoprotein signal peptidase n=1 Tax=Candidatus Zymogenus saltonus TaxID=2844893 RepID=A0A9D8PPG7_9DELT|nr:signal peptidase II [Candidatus Zymogenus saltonus]